MNLFARKSIDELRSQTFAEGEHGLKRALSATNLVALGIGAIIGTGIFVLTGSAAAQYAGPAIVIAFIIAGVGCAFAGLPLCGVRRHDPHRREVRRRCGLRAPLRDSIWVSPVASLLRMWCDDAQSGGLAKGHDALAEGSEMW